VGDEIPTAKSQPARKGTPVERRGRKARGPPRSAQLPRSIPLTGITRASAERLTDIVGKGHKMLARIRKAQEEREGGFTLIELLVVIIIIGILAAIAIPVFLNQRKKATEASMKSDLRTVANEMETYYTDWNVYPAALGALPATLKTSTGNTLTVVSGGVSRFCLRANNVDASITVWYYDSSGGGLLKTACT
jgi:type IV pilus assembly protein PilA